MWKICEAAPARDSAAGAGGGGAAVSLPHCADGSQFLFIGRGDSANLRRGTGGQNHRVHGPDRGAQTDSRSGFRPAVPDVSGGKPGRPGKILELCAVCGAHYLAADGGGGPGGLRILPVQWKGAVSHLLLLCGADADALSGDPGAQLSGE